MAEEGALAKSQDPGSTHDIASPDGADFHERLRRLVERRAAIYTMGDSSSVPTHVAADILRSVCFVLGIDPEQPDIPERLLSVDLEEEFRRRLSDIERRVELSGQLWRAVVAIMPPIPNTALQDTLHSIGDFPKHYDFRSMAHEIACTFDYPLCHQVPDSFEGVDHINEYLRRLLFEADLLRRFEVGACVRVLERSSPDHVDLLVNLYEPVATNAIGRALMGIDPAPLRLADADRAEIARTLGPLGAGDRERVLRGAALAVCDGMGVADEDARAYLGALVPELLPRIEVALVRGDLRGVFV
jgi:hypothetical protein